LLGKAIRVPGACGLPGVILIALTGVAGIVRNSRFWTSRPKFDLEVFSTAFYVTKGVCGVHVDESAPHYM
jgi:hypothetical protein